MSTQPPPASPTPPAAATPAKPKAPEEVTVISHSMLLYWWPVWVCGFIMAGITLADSWLLANVPPGSKVEARPAEVNKPDGVKVEAVITPLEVKAGQKGFEVQEPKIRMSRSKALGVVFFTVLMLVVFITNVPLRGMWSVFVIILVALISLILHLAGLWNEIVETVSMFDVRINFGGYIFISTALLILWIAVVVFFDRRIYIVFTPRSFRVCTQIGEGEKVFDTVGMKLERKPNDLFRHYVLGLGAGDLIVKTFGASNEHFDMDNVMWINSKVAKIEQMLQEHGGDQSL